MKHARYEDVEAEDVDIEGAEGVRMRLLVGEQDGAPNFFMRRFELAPGGRTPRHSHSWEHEVYLLEGEGTVFGAGQERACRPGDVIYVAPNEEHQFMADAETPLVFLCMIPKQESP